MTREEIVTMVLLNTSRRDRQDYILASIDLALIEISQVHTFISMREALELTVQAEESQVDLPSGTIGIWEARVSIPDDAETEEDEADTANVTPFLIMSKKEVTERIPSLDRNSTGRPSIGYVDNGVLKIVPPANETYKLEMTIYRSYQAVTTGQSTPSVNLDQAIIAWVTAQVFRSVENPGMATYWMQEYSRALSLAIRHDNNKMHVEGRGFEGFSPGASRRYESGQPELDPFAMR